MFHVKTLIFVSADTKIVKKDSDNAEKMDTIESSETLASTVPAAATTAGSVATASPDNAAKTKGILKK